MKVIGSKIKSTSLLVTIIIVLIVVILRIAFSLESTDKSISSYSLNNIPEYNEHSYVYLYDNVPNFTDSDYQRTSFEYYSNLDSLGRVGVAFANISKDTMPTEERESISSIYPTGWQQKKYDIISGKYLYNRCHLIGYQLTGENANEKNLMTCTRSMNVEGMLPYENKVANYIDETNNHVLYRVTPIFDGDNLLASGVQIEASSVEDKCGEICFNVYMYNNQEGIEINYHDGTSKVSSH